tara:strand:- start:1635 stop:1766 length:132 start_codon:yes stop_codon:yes gene_type:complete
MNSTDIEYFEQMKESIKRFEDPLEWDKALKRLEDLKECKKFSL